MKFQDAAKAVFTVRGFQGLVLDNSGLSGLLVAVAERTSGIFVQTITVKRPGYQPLIRNFRPDPGTFMDSILTRIHIQRQLDDYEIEGVILLPFRIILGLSTLSLVLGFIAVGTAFGLIELKKRHDELLVARKTEDLALQIAHDIRSPLAALNSIVSRSVALPEDERIIVRSATSRITDIANNLLAKKREIHKPQVDPGHAISLQLLPGLVEAIVSEKRQQFRDKIEVTIDSILGKSSYGVFSKVEPIELKRVLSNLINNAVEALPGKGCVWVELEGLQDQAVVKIQDNGNGIPAEILSKLGQKGSTHGKPGGSGLGLYHAKTSVEKWGGSLDIQSLVGQGTSIVIRLPREKNPPWFIGELLVQSGAAVVILDDDSSIHQVWENRLAELRLEKGEIEAWHFSTPDQLKEWYLKHDSASKPAVYLVDYELIGSKETGLDLIERLGIAERSILVTSRFEEGALRARCAQAHVRLIPKSMAAFVPIRLLPPRKRYHAILVDDDELVRITWGNEAKRREFRFLAFPTANAFFDRSPEIDFDSPIYIDSNLGNGVRGEEVSAQVAALGFRSVFLATGYDADQFEPMPWLKGITGKEAPWKNPQLNRRSSPDSKAPAGRRSS